MVVLAVKNWGCYAPGRKSSAVLKIRSTGNRLEGICAYVSFDFYAETEQSALSLSHVYCWTQRTAHKSHLVSPTGLIKDSQFWQCYCFVNE